MSFSTLQKVFTRSRSTLANDARKRSRSTLRIRRLCGESLEDRRMLSLGSISGTVFEDLDADGFHDSGEPGLEDWTVALERGEMPEPMLTILNPTPAADDRFGCVAAVGDNILVSSLSDDTAATDAGAAYLFDGSTGELLQTFLHPTAEFGDHLGRVAALGNNVLVGANYADAGATDSGAVYLFDGMTGELLQTFLNPTPGVDDRFGVSVAAVGENVLVGAQKDDTGAIDAGAAYLFNGTTGELLQTFLNPTPEVDDRFGWPVAAVGDNVLVGARLDDTGATDAGAAYLFDAETGELLHTFHNPSPEVDDYFGWSVAALGDNVLVGAFNKHDAAGLNTGAAYLFDAETGELLRTFLNPTPEAGDTFGGCVRALGKNVLVGASKDDTAGPDAGAVYLFDGSTGELLNTFLNPTPAGENEGFGGWSSIAVVGSKVVIGARLDDTLADNAGAVYVFDGRLSEPVVTFANPTPDEGDLFGASIAVMGDNLLVGARNDDTGAEDAGIAYLLDGATGNLLQTFSNPNPEPFDRFGFSIAAVGQNVLVGAQGKNHPSGALAAGAAYLFDGSSGNLLRTFWHPSPQTNDFLGKSVAGFGDDVLVGSYLAAERPGEALMFDSSTGSLIHTFQSPTPLNGDKFGRSLAVSGDNILIGAPESNLSFHYGGAAYLFDGTTGNLLQSFFNPTPATNDRFGATLAFVGDNVLIGALRDDTIGEDAGIAYLYDAATGNLLHTFLNPSLGGQHFGSSVGTVGGSIVIGAKREDNGGVDAGTAYLFDASSGALLRTFRNPTPEAGDLFGAEALGSENKLLVSSICDDAGGRDAGAVYLFDASLSDPQLTIPNPTPAANDQFGRTLATLGNNVLAGAHGDDTGAEDAGVVYLLDGSTGDVLHTFLNPTPEDPGPLFPGVGDSFGKHVVALGNKVLISAIGDNTGAEKAGAAYLFEFNASTDEWDLKHTYLNPTPEPGESFGTVAALGDNVLVGAGFANHGGLEKVGEAYLFDGTTGELLWTFENPTPEERDTFGGRLTAVGDHVLISANCDNTAGQDVGAAYLYERNSLAEEWELKHTFLDPTPHEGDVFGTRVAAMGDNVLIAELGGPTGSTRNSAVHLFDGSTGELLRTFVHPYPTPGDRFGHSIVIAGSNILIGANRDDTGAANAGAAYLFDGTTGELLQVLRNPTPDVDDQFASASCVVDGKFVIGARFEDTAGIDAGILYIFEGISTTHTDADGNYSFPSLESGAYEVREIVKSGFTQTSPGGDGMHSVVLAAGGNLPGLDFGNAVFNARPGDFDADGDVDGDDFLTWQDGFGTPSGANLGDGDADGDGDVDGDDFLVWQSNFGQSVPATPGDFDVDGDVDGDDFLAWQIGFGTSSGANLEDGDADSDGDVDGDDFLIWQQNFGSGSGSGSAAALPEQVRAKRECTVDRVFDEFSRRSKIMRETVIAAGEPLDELVINKLRSQRHRLWTWPGIR